jgi:hypothetical protein
MSEENKDLENKDKPNEPEMSAAEHKARSQGWVSEEEWTEQGKDVSEWVDERQFNIRGELMTRIQQQSKQLHDSNGKIDQLSKALKKMGELNEKVAEEQYKKAINTLKRQKASAMREEDTDAVIEIDDKIDELKEAQKAMKEDPIKVEPAPVPASNEPTAEYQAWVAKPENLWYTNDPILRGAADALGMEYYNQNPDVPLQKVFDFVSKQIRLEMPHKFGNSKQREPAGVIDGSGKGNKPRGRKAKFTAADLTEDQLRMAKTFVETKALPDIQTYIDQLVEIGELG